MIQISKVRCLTNCFQAAWISLNVKNWPSVNRGMIILMNAAIYFSSFVVISDYDRKAFHLSSVCCWPSVLLKNLGFEFFDAHGDKLIPCYSTSNPLRRSWMLWALLATLVKMLLTYTFYSTWTNSYSSSKFRAFSLSLALTDLLRRADKRGLFPAWIKPAVCPFMCSFRSLTFTCV